jgi:hypothetical protein
MAWPSIFGNGSLVVEFFQASELIAARLRKPFGQIFLRACEHMNTMSLTFGKGIEVL